ncbi:MAG: metallopeptidase TldD-related protein, partial [Bacteroidales bacterium]
ESPIDNINFDAEEWKVRLKKYSNVFSPNKDIQDGSASLSFSISRKYFVNSEGTSVVQNNTHAHLYLFVEGQADDGMELPLFKSYYAHFPGDLPKDDIILQDAIALNQKFIDLKSAPVVDSYVGPALLSNDAAGVFFHEIFGHRVEGARMKQESDGQTFKKKLNEYILHPDISVIFDPTIQYYKNIPLNGSYRYDEEGVKGERTVVVEKGILKNFLMTRTPIDSFPLSNGHARAQAGKQPVSRQSNLIVETTKPYTDAQLRQMLINEAKAQGKEYGYLFGTVQGGFTMTGRYMPNSFNVTPLEVYRVYVDGRPDELVRGVDLVGTPLAMFSKVEAVGDTPGNFAGTCGAESGGVPAGCCSPALFVKQIETQKKNKEQGRPPIIERPYSQPKSVENFDEIAFKAMQDEIANNLKNLKLENLKSPYYINYLITNAHMFWVETSLGGLIVSKEKPYRDKEVNIMVGNNQLNNLNFITENDLFGYNSGGIVIPIENDYNGIRQSLWLATDKAYKQSAEKMESKKAAMQQQNLSPELLNLADRSEVNIQTSIQDRQEDNIVMSHLENTALELSNLFLQYPNFTNSGANIYGYQADAYFLSSEGIKYKQPFSIICIRVFAQIVAPDGEPLADCFNIYFTDMSQIPSMDVLREKTKNMADMLEKLRMAPVIDETYSGPVMLSDEAVGQVFANAFIENKNGLLTGRKQIASNPDILRWYGKYFVQENNLEAMMDKKVISRDLSVSAIDKTTHFGNTVLIGAYNIDADGVSVDTKTPLIVDGVLQNLLSDRIPSLKINASNAHNRLALSYNKLTTSLCAGVIEMTSNNKMAYNKLKKKLLALAKEEDYEYAYIITKLASRDMEQIPGMSKYMPENEMARPIYAYKISVKDGSETLVRMTKLSSINIKSFKRIFAVASEQQAYNTLLKGKRQFDINSTYDFKLSGIPTSFILPKAIIFEELEVEKDKDIIMKKEPFIQNPLLR